VWRLSIAVARVAFRVARRWRGTSYTLNPNPALYTLQPTPYALHPTPYTLHLGP